MSPVAGERMPSPPSKGPGLRVRLSAVAVVVALALLAAYTVFSGPTKVPVKAPTSGPTRVAPPAEQQEPESEGASRVD